MTSQYTANGPLTIDMLEHLFDFVSKAKYGGWTISGFVREAGQSWRYFSTVIPGELPPDCLDNQMIERYLKEGGD